MHQRYNFLYRKAETGIIRKDRGNSLEAIRDTEKQ